MTSRCNYCFWSWINFNYFEFRVMHSLNHLMDLVPLCSMSFNVVSGSPLFALINIDTPMHLFFFLSTKTTLYNTQKRASCQEMENILRFENDSIVTCDIYRVLTWTGKVGRHFPVRENTGKLRKMLFVVIFE